MVVYLVAVLVTEAGIVVVTILEFVELDVKVVVVRTETVSDFVRVVTTVLVTGTVVDFCTVTI